MARKNPDFESMIAIHGLLVELPKAAAIFTKMNHSVKEALGNSDQDGLAQVVIFCERIEDMRVPKEWRWWARRFQRGAAHKLALHARNPLDRLAEVD